MCICVSVLESAVCVRLDHSNIITITFANNDKNNSNSSSWIREQKQKWQQRQQLKLIALDIDIMSMAIWQTARSSISREPEPEPETETEAETEIITKSSTCDTRRQAVFVSFYIESSNINTVRQKKVYGRNALQSRKLPNNFIKNLILEQNLVAKCKSTQIFLWDARHQARAE